MNIIYGNDIPIDNAELTINKREEKTILVQKDSIKAYLHRKHRPVEEARKQIDLLGDIDLQSNIVILWGIGLGYLVEEFFEKEKSAKVILFEPSKEIFELALRENTKLKDIIEKHDVSVCIGDVRDRRLEVTALFLNNGFDGVKYITNPRYVDIFEKEYRELTEFLSELMKSASSLKGTVLQMSLNGQMNLLKNMKYLFESYPVSMLDNKFEGSTGILVAAGPSLNKSIEFLKKAQGKAVIVSVDTALKVLLKEGIKPDFVVAFEYSDWNFEHFKDIDFDEIPLIYEMGSCNKVIEKHKGKKILISTEGSYIDKLYASKNIKVGSLNTLFSVSVTAFEFLNKIGCSTVITTGLDLSYKKGHKTHAAGTAFADTPTLPAQIPVKNVCGEQVYTVSGYYETLKQIELQIKKNEDVEYINVTDEGAAIEGAKRKSIESAIKGEFEMRSNKSSVEIFDKHQRLNLNQSEMRDFIEELKEAYITTGRIISKIEKCGIKDTLKNNKIINNMRKIDELVFYAFENFQILSLIRLKLEFRYEETLSALSNEKDEEVIRERVTGLYGEIYNDFKEVRPLLEKLCIYLENKCLE